MKHLILPLLMSNLSALTAIAGPAGQPVEPFAEGTRQVHLDFHTSEHIPDIGKQFDKQQFQQALITGKVNSINIFAKGHHGWSYYPTTIGKMHPHLDFDLMGAQIEACREIGVKVCLYFTVGWSVNDAVEHPEWIYVNKEGTSDHHEHVKDKGPDDPFNGWYYLAPEGPYVDLIVKQVAEILQKYDVDGIWYDIVTPFRINYNAIAREDWRQRGIDPEDDQAVYRRHIEKYEEFMERATAVIREHAPQDSVFFNGTTANFNSFMLSQFRHELYRWNTKQDLEDLPTAWGGYDLFPWRSKYFANLGQPIVAMSGKFHKAWGEFGGFKHRDALLYEAASMVAFGANVNIGDQLHPSGLMEMATYENIGYAFDYVEKIEAYGIGARHVAATGLYVGDDIVALEGAAMFLLENQVNFNVVNTLDDWSGIEVLVLPSATVLDEDVPRIQAFVRRGGKVLAMGKSILNRGSAFIDIGADYLGPAQYDIDYTVAGAAVSGDLVNAPFLNYTAAPRFAPHKGTEVLAGIREPYFSRTMSHYSSHANTPYVLEEAPHAAVMRKDNVIYIAHDIDRQYREEGARVHRQLFFNALKLLRNKPLVEVEMPSMGRINLLHQPDQRRYVLHLLYASPVQKGSVKVIEDMPPLYDIPVWLNLPEAPVRAYLVPGMEPVPLEQSGTRIKAIIPRMQCHTALVVEY